MRPRPRPSPEPHDTKSPTSTPSGAARCEASSWAGASGSGAGASPGIATGAVLVPAMIASIVEAGMPGNAAAMIAFAPCSLRSPALYWATISKRLETCAPLSETSAICGPSSASTGAVSSTTISSTTVAGIGSGVAAALSSVVMFNCTNLTSPLSTGFKFSSERISFTLNTPRFQSVL